MPVNSRNLPWNNKEQSYYTLASHRSQPDVTQTAVTSDFRSIIDVLCRSDTVTFEQTNLTSSELHPSKACTLTKTATAFDASDPAESKSAVSEAPHVPPLPFAANWSMTLLLDRTISTPAVEAQNKHERRHGKSTKDTPEEHERSREDIREEHERARTRHERITKKTRKEHEGNTKETRKEHEMGTKETQEGHEGGTKGAPRRPERSTYEGNTKGSPIKKHVGILPHYPILRTSNLQENSNAVWVRHVDWLRSTHCHC